MRALTRLLVSRFSGCRWVADSAMDLVHRGAYGLASCTSTGSLVLALLLPSLQAQTPSKASPKTIDERVVEIIESKDSVARRIAAVNLVQAYVCKGVESSLAAIAIDETEDYRLRRRALGVIGQYPGRHLRSAIETALDDKDDVFRLHAVSALKAARQPWASRLLMDLLTSPTESFDVRIRAAMALSAYPVNQTSSAMHALIEELREEDLATQWNLRYLSSALDLLTDPKHRSCLQPFLETEGFRTRARAEHAWVRLGGSAAQLAGKNRYGAILDAEGFAPRFRSECQQIRQAGWEPSTWQEFLFAAEQVPLVFCGESHTGTESFLRRLQCQIVDHLSRPKGVKLAVGYEPSALLQQKSVVEYAASKGLIAFAMEKRWKEFSPLSALDHRDLECAEIANEYLGKAKAHRLLVIRGQFHVNPNGYLLSKIKAQAVVLFTMPLGLGIPLQMRHGRLHAPGQVLRSRRYRNLWFVSVDKLGQGPSGRPNKGEQELLEALQD